MRTYVLEGELSADEEHNGFERVELQPGRFAVARSIETGMFVVKMRSDEGRVEYVVCNENLDPLFVAGSTLLELRERFG